MKFGFRRPSLRGMISARTSPKRLLRQSLGLKAPRGWGWLTNPKRALYNRVYSRTTFGWQDLLKVGRRRRASQGCLVMIAMLMGMLGGVISMVVIVVRAR